MSHGFLCNSGVVQSPSPTPLISTASSVAVKISPLCQRTQPWPAENVAAPHYLQSATFNCPPPLQPPPTRQAWGRKLHTCTTATAKPPRIHKSLSVCTQSPRPFIKFCYFQELVSQIASIHILSPSLSLCVGHIILRSFTIQIKVIPLNPSEALRRDKDMWDTEKNIMLDTLL